jgi:hypothetical protein
MVASALFLLSMMLRWPLFMLLRLIQRFKCFGFLFLVYPGGPADMHRYLPKRLAWLRHTRMVSSNLNFIGMIRCRTGPNGLVFAIPEIVQALARNERALRLLVGRLRWAAPFLGIKHVALAGRLWSLLEARGIERPVEIVSGIMGTVFMLSRAVSRVAGPGRRDGQAVKAAIFGMGELGRRLVEHLRSLGYSVLSLRAKSDPDVKDLETAKAQLKDCKVVVVIASDGSRFHPYLHALEKDTVILDDTHPPMRRTPPQGHAYRVVASLPGLRFIPRLAGFDATWVPGCLIEGIVRSQGVFESGPRTQDDFDRLTHQTGSDVQLVPIRASGLARPTRPVRP